MVFAEIKSKTYENLGCSSLSPNKNSTKHEYTKHQTEHISDGWYELVAH